MKPAYVCGPLTDLPSDVRERLQSFYEKIADLCERTSGARAFVPHEHYDPIEHASFTPQEVDEAERRQICENTSFLIVVAIAPSWGGGIEVEMARQSNVPVIILCSPEKKVSRLLLGNPAVERVISCETTSIALSKLEEYIKSLALVS